MAAVGQRYVTPDQFEVDTNGVPLAGGQLFFYLTGTSTPLDTWNDVNLTTPNPNPVIADANGRFGNIWLSPSQAYKVILFSAATPDNPSGSQIWAFDPVGPAAGGAVSNIAGIIGEVRDFAGPAASIPALWYLCAGQAVSRTTFATLFSVIGTTWGAGDASTTFNLPDLRGRGTFGKDDMGGTPANRLTSGVSGVAGNTLGAVGGNQAMQTHTHAVNDPTHNHTDPGHHHGTVSPANQPSAANGTNNKLVTSTGGQTDDAFTGIEAASTGITLSNTGTGSSQNVPPGAVMNKIIYAGA